MNNAELQLLIAKSARARLELSFFEENKHPRGEHGRFASKPSIIESTARSTLHHFLKTLDVAAHDPLLIALVGGVSLYYLAPIITGAIASATINYGVKAAAAIAAPGAYTAGKAAYTAGKAAYTAGKLAGIF